MKPRNDMARMPQFTVTKGAGRASMILFAIVYTYLEMWNSLDNHEKKDFVRRSGVFGWYLGGMWMYLVWWVHWVIVKYLGSICWV